MIQTMGESFLGENGNKNGNKSDKEISLFAELTGYSKYIYANSLRDAETNGVISSQVCVYDRVKILYNEWIELSDSLGNHIMFSNKIISYKVDYVDRFEDKITVEVSSCKDSFTILCRKN